ELGLERRVHFAGSVADVERLYRDADLLVSSSVTESFGFPLIEAMAAGVPIVATDIPASKELAGDDAFSFPTGDVRGAAQATDRACQERAPAMRARLDRARERAARHSWSSNASAVAKAIEDARRAQRAGRSLSVSG